MSQTRAFLKRFVIIGAVPLAVAGLVFAFFQAIQDSYSVEARLRVEPVDLIHESSLLPADQRQRQRVVSMVDLMEGERMRTLLAYHLLLHDLTEPPPFWFHSLADSLSRAQRLELVDVLMHRLERLEAVPLPGDSLLEGILTAGNLPGRLEQLLAVDPVPGGNLIQVTSADPHSERASFLVNSLCQLFVRYYEVVEREHLERSLGLLRDMAQRQKQELVERSLLVQRERARLRNGDPEMARLRQEISQLEHRRQGLQQQVEVLRTALEAARKREAAAGQIVPVRQGSPEPTREEIALELGSVMAQLDFAAQQLEDLQHALASREAALIDPLEREALRAEEAYLQLLQKIRATEAQIAETGQALTLVAKGTSRYPHPLASSLLAALAGVSSLLIWLIMLFQLNYWRWPDHSPRNMPASATAKSH